MSFDYSKGSVMLEFKAAAAKKPTIEEVKQQFKLTNDEIDVNYPPISLPRPEGESFIVVISPEAAARIEEQKPDGFVQNWGNHKSEPF